MMATSAEKEFYITAVGNTTEIDSKKMELCAKRPRPNAKIFIPDWRYTRYLPVVNKLGWVCQDQIMQEVYLKVNAPCVVFNC